MRPHVHIVIYHYLVIQLFSQTVLSKCPADAEQKIQLCTTSSLPNFGLGPPSGASPPAAIKSSIQMSRDSCQTNKLEESAKCIQKFLDLCQGTTDREQLLQRLLDKQKIMQTVQYFCASLPIFEENAECISRQHDMAENCSKEEALRFRTIMEAKATDDVLIQANCRFHRVATSCLEDYVFNNCGLKAAEFIETITIGQTPPSCLSKERKYSQNSPTNSAFHINADFRQVIILLIIKIILR